MQEAKIWEEEVIIPTYEVGKPDKNPMFLEKRVYQGSSGRIYPYPTIDKISRKKTDKTYHAVYLENEYIRIMVLPELGGRIQRAYDKTGQYDFIYYNHVIKPALVGLLGPWISGGIEFNWPQHHRPTTFMPLDHMIRKHKDGSKTLLINDVDQMYGTKSVTGYTIYPGKAYIEISGQLYNGTPVAQTFLWWANPAVAVNDHTQSVFPPDVHYVMDHGKRDVSEFPIARGIYYKHDYSSGVDISRYRNIPVPTSYMAVKSDYDFLGGYDNAKEAGVLHIADHHYAPGKKQWTWGCGDFGKAWDKNLTETDGPYIELMTGVYTENQPDFSWLKPFEEKTFHQYFMPYKKAGAVKNATVHAAVNIEQNAEGIFVCVYASERYENAGISIQDGEKELYSEKVLLSPTNVYVRILKLKTEKPEELSIKVCAQEGEELVSYYPQKNVSGQEVHPAEPARLPRDIMTNEELLLTGMHIEQHRHATFLPDPYYLEGLERDGGDVRLNNAYGMLLMKRGDAEAAEKYFRNAIRRLTWRSPNPYDSESYYDLGLSLLGQYNYAGAFDAFYKATWSSEQQEGAFYFLALISIRWKKYTDALSFVDKSLVKNAHHVKALGLKAICYRKLELRREAQKQLQFNLKLDPFDYISGFERYLWNQQGNGDFNKIWKKLADHLQGKADRYLLIARGYMEYGLYGEAETVLGKYPGNFPMIDYYRAFCFRQLHEHEQSLLYYQKAEKDLSDYCFPNQMQDVMVLKDAMDQMPEAAKAPYYLGNLFYDKLQYGTAVKLWETSAENDPFFPTVHRNLAIAYYNKEKDYIKAREEMEKAAELDPGDFRVFIELDQLYKKLKLPFVERTARYLKYPKAAEERDDAALELVTLYNQTGRYEEAYEFIMQHHFQPWEGAEGKVTQQYRIALAELAKESVAGRQYENAAVLLATALLQPENLGEGRLEGDYANDIYYYLGLVNKKLGKTEAARENFKKATEGNSEPSDGRYYNDQPADMILYRGLAYAELDQSAKAAACFSCLMECGKRYLKEPAAEDYFAVSLPDFLIFETDMQETRQAQGYYLMALGYIGYRNMQKANENFNYALAHDYNHQKSRLYLKMVEKNML